MELDLDRLKRVMQTERGFDVDDAMVLYIAAGGADLMRTMLKLKTHGLIAWDRNGRLLITPNGVDMFTRIYLKMTDEDDFSHFEGLSQALWDNYPQMLQPSTGRPVKGSLGDVALRLRTLPKEYDISKYSDEEIVSAEKRYLDSQDMGYTYILTLPDFILQVKDGIVKSRLFEYLSSETPAPPSKMDLVTL